MFWYDLETTDQGQFYVDFNFLDRFKVPSVIYALSVDPEGRLLGYLRAHYQQQAMHSYPFADVYLFARAASAGPPGTAPP